MTPKTTLGTRAAIEHLFSLGFLDPNDPDQKYKVFQKFGQTDLNPSLDIHMQAALRKQQAFEEWAQNAQAQQESFGKAQEAMMQYQETVANMPPPVEPAPVLDKMGNNVAPQQDPAAMMPPPPPLNQFTPLAWKPWYNPVIHKQEFLKWANGDAIQQLLTENPPLEQLLVAHLAEIDGAIQMQMMAQQGPPAPQKPGGAGKAMSNSNGESAGAQNSNDHTQKRQGAA
jgi:hypothetical protein